MKLNFFKSLGVLVFAAFMSHGAAHAQQNQTHCDPQVYDSMKTRAWITAQREISQNQNLIFKPDSVLEYSCFDWAASQVGMNPDHAPNRQMSQAEFDNPPFIDPVRPGFAPSISRSTTYEALFLVPMRWYQSHLVLNYPDRYLSDRASLNWSAGLGNTNLKPPEEYKCTQMSQIWNEAKCLDFTDQPQDGYFDFDFYVNIDPRLLPSSSKQCDVPIPFPLMVKEAFNQKEKQLVIGATEDIDLSLKFDGIYYAEDKADLHFDYLGAPKERGQHTGEEINPNTCSSSPKIPTGASVVYNDGSSKLEYVCLNPSCFYNPRAGVCQ